MRKRVVLSGVIALLLVAIMGMGVIGSGAIFSDTETAAGNTFTAGTLNLTVDDLEGENVVHLTEVNWAPGDSIKHKWVLKNTGSIPGVVSVEFSPITNEENGMNTPEIIAEGEPYGFQGARATLGDPATGELGEFLKPALLKWDGFNFFGPDMWAVGPFAYGQAYGLNALGGQTYYPGGTLGPDETINIYLSLSLAEDIVAWDGCGSHQVNDNVIQSDGVLFDIMFHLDQAP